MSGTLESGPAENVAADMAKAWRRGDCLPAEHYLDVYPDLADDPESAVRLVYEEVCLRQERGEQVGAEELRRRFPRWAGELALMLDCDQLVQQQLAPHFPNAGDVLGEFRLLAELGRGVHGRVFLATQPALAGRAVVLKLTPRQDCESRSLARLQHTHIIPLYGAYDFPARNLRAMCQPHLGGATLAHLLEALRDTPPARRTGAMLLEALDRVGTPIDSPARGPRQALAKLAYPEAVCWVGACLADGLHYAHERWLLHLDVKPSNVLIAADGQPLLLDFHLAQPPVPAGAVAEGMGGTPEYMSPEQRDAFDFASHTLPTTADVDHRADIYSLGRLLYVALGGDNSQVSPGLADIVARCLALAPKDRYPSAASLAADLRRHLAGLPLHGVANRSLLERWQKWRRRRPHGLLWAALLLALAAVPLALAAVIFDRVRDGRAALEEGREQLRRHAFREAALTLSRGKARVAAVPGCAGLAADLDTCLSEARRAEAAERLHAVCERLRLLVGVAAVSRAEMLALDGHCAVAWEARDLVEGEGVREDLADLALLWADLKRRLSPDGEAQAGYLLDPNLTPVARGRELLRAGNLGRAAEELACAAEARPQDFWAHFYGGTCAYRRGRHSEAVHSFGVAVALSPECAEAYYNRALAHTGAGDVAAALRDYDRALALSPNLASASLNRGALLYRQGRHEAAVADLERTLKQGADPAAAHYNLALVRLAQKDAEAAARHLDAALRHAPGHGEALALRERLGHGRR